MDASVISLKRLMERRLSRKGIIPILRGGVIFFGQSDKAYVSLISFCAMLEVDSEISQCEDDRPITDVLWMRRKRYVNPLEPFLAYQKQEKQKDSYKAEQSRGELEEFLHHVNTPRV